MSDLVIKDFCWICLQEVKNPKQLTCLHEFCLPCLEEFVVNNTFNGMFQCPRCHIPISVPADGVANFPCLTNAVSLPRFVESNATINVNGNDQRNTNISFTTNPSTEQTLENAVREAKQNPDPNPVKDAVLFPFISFQKLDYKYKIVQDIEIPSNSLDRSVATAADIISPSENNEHPAPSRSVSSISNIEIETERSGEYSPHPPEALVESTKAISDSEKNGCPSNSKECPTEASRSPVETETSRFPTAANGCPTEPESSSFPKTSSFITTSSSKTVGQNSTSNEPFFSSVCHDEAVTGSPCADYPTNSCPYQTDPSKCNASKTDPSKCNASKTDPSKCSVSKTDPSKCNASKTDPSKCNASKTDPSKCSASETDPSKSIAIKTDPSKCSDSEPDTAKCSASKTDPSKCNASKTDPSKCSAIEPDPSKCSVSKTDPSKCNASKTDPPKCSASKTDPSECSASKTDPSKCSAIKHDPSQCSAIKTDPSQCSTSKTDPSKCSDREPDTTKCSASENDPSKSTLYNERKEDLSENDPSKCNVCENEKFQFRCVDCEQNMCMTCNNLHRKMPVCKNHIVLRWEDWVKFRGTTELNIGQATQKAVNFNPKDTCINHGSVKADVYCSQCKTPICFRCLSKQHNGHKFLALDEDLRAQTTQKLNKLDNDLDNHIRRLDKIEEKLNTKHRIFKDSVKEICDQVDDRTTEMIARVKKVGETMKKLMKQTCDEDIRRKEYENRIIQLFKDSESQKGIVQALRAHAKSVLQSEDSMVKTIEEVFKLDEDIKKIDIKPVDIPDVPYFFLHPPNFDLDSVIFENLGKFIFGVFAYQVRLSDFALNKWHASPKFVFSGENWELRLFRNTSTVRGMVFRVSRKGDNTYTLKVLNHSNDKLSIAKKGRRMGGDIELIDWAKLTDPKSGFVVEQCFTVLVTHIEVD